MNQRTKLGKTGIDHSRTPINPVDQPLSRRQVNFLLRVVAAIPRLFAALEEGNVKSELILGVRRVKNKQARLKLVAELVDPGANPLETHGSREQESTSEQGFTIEQESKSEQGLARGQESKSE